jgi:hypothetical protein
MLARSSNIYHVRKTTTQGMGLLRPFLNSRSELSNRNGVLLYTQLNRPMVDYAYRIWIFAARIYIRRFRVYNVTVFAFLQAPSGTYVSGRLSRIWVFNLSPTTSVSYLRALTESSWSGEPPSSATLLMLTLIEVRPVPRCESKQLLLLTGQSRTSVGDGQVAETNHAWRL